MEKKSQIQMGENVIIIFIFFILLVFAVVFYSRLQTTKVQQKADADVEGKALQIAQRIAVLPELQCTKNNADIFPGCYDEYSLKGLESLTMSGLSNAYYYDLFGYSKITITKIPISVQQTGNTIVIYNNIKEKSKSIITTNSLISVCDFTSPLYRKGDCSFAVLKVEVYN